MKNKTKNNKQLYGVFYKNRGQWAGPYYGETYSKTNWNHLENLLDDCKSYTKKSAKIAKV